MTRDEYIQTVYENQPQAPDSGCLGVLTGIGITIFLGIVIYILIHIF
jgi:hypothetical protein